MAATIRMDECYFGQCKHEPAFKVTNRFGKRLTYAVCSEHKPGAKRPERLAHLPPASASYEVEPLAG